jgi:hypothetical protein
VQPPGAGGVEDYDETGQYQRLDEKERRQRGMRTRSSHDEEEGHHVEQVAHAGWMFVRRLPRPIYTGGRRWTEMLEGRDIRRRAKPLSLSLSIMHHFIADDGGNSACCLVVIGINW